MKPMHNNNNNNAARRGRYRPNGGGNPNQNRNNYSNAARPTGHGRNHMYDSNGPEGRIRGTAVQVYDKYIQLARDAAATGDSTKAENFSQHAEHYFRINAAFAESRETVQRPEQQPGVDANAMYTGEKAEQLAQYEPYAAAPQQQMQQQQDTPVQQSAPQIPQEQPGFDGFEPPEFLRVKS